MGKIGLFLTLILVISIASLMMPNEAADIGKYLYESAPQKISQTANAIYSIPPTPSWDEIEIANDVTVTPNPQTFINASTYTDKFFFITDGSILLNITTYP